MNLPKLNIAPIASTAMLLVGNKMMKGVRTLLLMLLATGLMISCNNDEPKNVEDPAPSDLMFSFMLDLGNLSSKAESEHSWDEWYDASEATAWEQEINEFVVYAYLDGQYYGRLTNYIQVGASNKFNARLIKANGDYAKGDEIKNKTMRFHVFVNSIPSPTTYETDLFTMNQPKLFNASGSFLPSYMPMWGMKQNTLSWESESDKVANLGTISLIRTLAKVELVITNNDDAYDYFDWVTLSGNSAKNFCFVPGYKATAGEGYAVEGVNDTKSLMRYYSTFNTAPSKTTSELKFLPLAGDKKRIIFYIPEQPNASGEQELKLTVKSGGEVFSNAPVKFRNYVEGVESGDQFNVIRNFHYKFELQIKKGVIKVVVKKWECYFVNDFVF